MEGILKDSDGDVDGTSEVLEGVAEGAFVRAGVGGTGVKKLDLLLDLLLPPDVLLDLLLPPEDLLPPDLGLLLGTTIRLLGPRVRPFGTALSKAGLTTGRPVPGSRLNGRTPRGSRSSVNSCSTVAAILLGF